MTGLVTQRIPSARRMLKSRAFTLALLLLSSGCVTTQSWVNNAEPASGICQVHTYWESRIQVTQDVVNGGRPLPGLAGRLYLFGPEIKFPEKGDGTVVVDLFDVSNSQPGAQPKHTEHWQFDAGNLKLLLRKDKIGWGYTLFLPWPNYTPDIQRVQLNVCYTPAKGNPLYAPPSTISLHNQATLTQSRQIVAPGAGSMVKQ